MWKKILFKVTQHGRDGELSHIGNKCHKYLALLLKISKWYLRHPDYPFCYRSYYTYIELVITTNCTLKCKHCCHYINRFRNSSEYATPEIINGDIGQLLDGIKWVDVFRILGGEPLLYPDIHKVVSCVLESKKVGMVEIVTNGTISLKKEIVSLFPNDRLNIYVSNYGKLSGKISEYANSPDINVTIESQGSVWRDYGNLIYQDRNDKELMKQYSRCCRERYILFDGMLFNCATSAFGSRLKAFQPVQDEFVDVRCSKNGDELRRKLKRIRARKFFTACNYCHYGTDKFVAVEAAEQ